MNKISIKGLDKAVVLASLYNRSKPLGLGYLQATPGDMPLEEARSLLEKRTYFDYLNGRIMKIDLKDDELDPWLYDRDLGPGAAQSVIDALRSNEAPPKNEEDLSKGLDDTIANAKPSTMSGNVMTLGIGDPELLEALESRREVFKKD